MTDDPKAMKCSSCARTLATVSPHGLKSATETEGCTTCVKFEELYEALNEADEEWARVESKSDRHHGKIAARQRHREVRMEFENWMIGMEELGMGGAGMSGGEDDVETGTERRDANCGYLVENARLECMDRDGRQDAEQRTEGQTALQDMALPKNEEVGKQDKGRARLYSPTTQPAGHNNTTDNITDMQPQPQRSIFHRPPLKRSRSMSSPHPPKRIKFSDGVEYRNDYRVSAMYQRTGDDYAPGRYAVPAGCEGYLDTSGSNQSFDYFMGTKKVKGNWVELTKEEMEARSEHKRILKESRKRRVSTDDDLTHLETEPGSCEELDGASEAGSAPLDARAIRVARRARRSSTPRTTRTENDAESHSNGLPRRGRRRLFDRTFGDVQEVPNDAQLDSWIAEAERQSPRHTEKEAGDMYENRSEEPFSDRASESTQKSPDKVVTLLRESGTATGIVTEFTKHSTSKETSNKCTGTVSIKEGEIRTSKNAGLTVPDRTPEVHADQARPQKPLLTSEASTSLDNVASYA